MAAAREDLVRVAEEAVVMEAEDRAADEGCRDQVDVEVKVAREVKEVVVVVKVVREVVEAREAQVAGMAQAVDRAEEAVNQGWAAEASAGSWTKKMTAPARKICVLGADQVVRALAPGVDPVVAGVFSRVADEVARADKEVAREAEEDKAVRVDRAKEAVEDKAVREVKEDRVVNPDRKDHRCPCADQPKMKSTLA